MIGMRDSAGLKDAMSVSFSKIVEKVSDKGILVNKRILELYRGQLKYYNYRSKFEEDGYVTGEFKFGTSVSTITSAAVLSNAKDKKHKFRIEFEKQYLITDKNKIFTCAEKQKRELVKWDFIVSSFEKATLIVNKINTCKSMLQSEEASAAAAVTGIKSANMPLSGGSLAGTIGNGTSGLGGGGGSNTIGGNSGIGGGIVPPLNIQHITNSSLAVMSNHSEKDNDNDADGNKGDDNRDNEDNDGNEGAGGGNGVGGGAADQEEDADVNSSQFGGQQQQLKQQMKAYATNRNSKDQSLNTRDILGRKKGDNRSVSPMSKASSQKSPIMGPLDLQNSSGNQMFPRSSELVISGTQSPMMTQMSTSKRSINKATFSISTALKKNNKRGGGGSNSSDNDSEEEKDIASPLPRIGRSIIQPQKQAIYNSLQSADNSNNQPIPASAAAFIQLLQQQSQGGVVGGGSISSQPSSNSPSLKKTSMSLLEISDSDLGLGKPLSPKKFVPASRPGRNGVQLLRMQSLNYMNNNNSLTSLPDESPAARKINPASSSQLSELAGDAGSANFTRRQNKQLSLASMSYERFNENLVETQRAKLKQMAENSHEFRFHSFLDASLRATGLENELKEGIKLFIYLGQFRQKAADAAKALVEDLMLPSTHSKYRAMRDINELSKIDSSSGSAGGGGGGGANGNGSSTMLGTNSPNKRSNLTASGTLLMNSSTTNLNSSPGGIGGAGNANSGDDGQSKQSSDEDTFYYLAEYNVVARVFWTRLNTIVPTAMSEMLEFDASEGLSYYDPTMMKFVGDQFRILKHIAGSCLRIRKTDHTFLLRVPLSVLVEYRGFKVLVQAKPSYESNLVYGPVIQDGMFKEYKKLQKYQEKIQQDSEKLGKKLRIKPHYFAWKRDIEPMECLLTFETEIHKSAGDRQTKAALLKFKQDAILIDQDKEDDQFYIEKYNDFFPINSFLDTQFDEKTLRFPRRLRPEFLLKKSSNPLNPEACFSQIRVGAMKKDNAIQRGFNKLFELEKQDSIDIQEVEEYVNVLSSSTLQKLIEKLDNLVLIPYDSHTIQEAMHSHGLNIKYISHIARMCLTPQVKLLLEQEMVARTIKNIIRYYLAQLSFDGKMYSTKQSRRQNIGRREIDPETQRANQAREVVANVDQSQQNMIVDVLNLTFEDSIEGRKFWEQINTQMNMEFNYGESVSLDMFEKGGLLNAIAFHSCFILTYGIDVFQPKGADKVFAPTGRFATKILQKLEQVNENNAANTSQAPNPAVPWNDPTEIAKAFATLPVSVVSTATVRNNSTNQSAEANGSLRDDEKSDIFSFQNIFSFSCESEMYQFKDIPINVYAQLEIPQDSQRQQYAISLADQISKALNAEHKERFLTLFRIAKTYFMAGMYRECIDYTSSCIQCLDFSPSVLLVDPLCLLVKCYIILKEKAKVQYLFWKIEEIIDFNLGRMHPLHCNLLNIMAVYYESMNQFDEQIILLQASCQLIQKLVGSKHPKTAQAMFELANVLSEQGMSVQAVGHYENAFYNYQAIKGEQNKRSADIGFKLAMETFALNDLNKSNRFCSYCLNFYKGQEQVYMSKIVDLMILSSRITKQKGIQNNQPKKGETSQAEALSQIWWYTCKNKYRDLQHMSELMKEYVECYLWTLGQEIKFHLSQQFEIILNRLIKINVLDSLQITENQEKSKEILLKEIDTDENNNDPYRLIERTFLIIAEDGSKNLQNNLIYSEKRDAEDEDFQIRRAKALFEHLICLIGVSFFKTRFLSSLL